MQNALVGRGTELDVVDASLAALATGKASAIALVGEAGIGKTRLLSELIGRAEARNHLVLTGTGSELDRDVPFWVFINALDEYLRGREPWFFAPLGDDVLADLGQVLPTVRAAASPALTRERFRSHRAVRLLLERLAANQPLVLVLDDVHWSDAGSWELLLTLLRSPPAAPVLIAFALRPHVAPDRVARELELAQRRGTLTCVELQELTVEEARELLGESVTRDATFSLLYGESGGNPFYLEELARSVGRKEVSTVGEGGTELLAGVRVPAAVMDALAGELADLSSETRLVLQAAAVAGEPFEPEIAAAAAQRDEGAVLVALDELLAKDVVRSTDVPRRFRFRHPLVRRAIYETIPGGWRLGAHERCADALAASGAPVAARAHHVELCARHGDPSAVAVLRQAGQSAVRRAPATAARWFQAALRLLPEGWPPEERIELLLAQADALLATGRFSESHAALLEAIRLVPEHSGPLRVRLITKCAAVEHQLGRYSQARTRLESALAALDSQTSEAVELMIELAINSLFRADFDAMNHWGNQAISAAEQLDAPALRVTALSVQAAGAGMAGDSKAGRAHRDRADEIVDVLSEDELAEHLDGLVHLALAEMYLDCFEDSRRHAELALTLSRATGQEDFLGPITATLGTCSWVRGRLQDALDVLNGGVEAARLMDDVQGLCWTLFNLSDAASAAGRLELALETAEESWKLAESLDPGPLRAHAGSALALALFNTGRAERAAELLAEAGGSAELPIDRRSLARPLPGTPHPVPRRRRQPLRRRARGCRSPVLRRGRGLAVGPRRGRPRAGGTRSRRRRRRGGARPVLSTLSRPSRASGTHTGRRRLG